MSIHSLKTAGGRWRHSDGRRRFPRRARACFPRRDCRAGLVLACLGMLWAGSEGAGAPRQPNIGYLYPAGGQPGTTLQVKLAGQYLTGVTNAVLSGEGITATVVQYVRPLNGKEINLLRDRLKVLQAALKPPKNSGARNGDTPAAVPRTNRASIQREIAEIKTKLANPKNRNRDNPQLAEDVTLRLVLAEDAAVGQRELRLVTAAGLSNPRSFYVNRLPEFAEGEPNDKKAEAGILPKLPVVVNGQIMPGDVDHFRVRLHQGTRLVVAARARSLIPYVADAVPGWFQATLTLYDTNGNELAYADDFRFHPDPVLYYEIPRDGDYLIEIRDAIYRGREDFVYRISVGELPFITSIFPLGGGAEQKTRVTLQGWNLPVQSMTVDGLDPGIQPISVQTDELTSNTMPFCIDTLPDVLEQEPNDTPTRAQAVQPALVLNGRIDHPNDRDVFRFEARAGDSMVAEVCARRLNSPLDSILKLTDATGHVLALNDDHEDMAAGLTTHHADSQIVHILPADGTYYLHLGDAQSQGGPAYAYRLRLSPPQPDFELRVVPSSLNARVGGTVPLTVYALRKDGFSNDIQIVLKDAPKGFSLRGERLTAKHDKARLSLRVPPGQPRGPLDLQLEGRATLGQRQLIRTAVPAEDMMQAFLYHHLVPSQNLTVAILERPKPRTPAKRAAAATSKPNKPPQAKSN